MLKISLGGFIRLCCIAFVTYGIVHLINPYNPYDDLENVAITVKYIPIQYISIKHKKKAETALECLQKNLYFEAANQGEDGMAAVANVTMNRVHSDNYPHDVCAVIHQLIVKNGQRVCQFTWYCEPPSSIPVHSEAWKLAGLIAKAALVGTLDSRVQDATFYHASYVTPPWAAEKELVIQIGDHIFYR